MATCVRGGRRNALFSELNRLAQVLLSSVFVDGDRLEYAMLLEQASAAGRQPAELSAIRARLLGGMFAFLAMRYTTSDDHELGEYHVR